MTKDIKQQGVLFTYLIAIVATTCLLIFFKNKPALNNWILAYSTITLVFVTLFYAIQTQRQVEQQKKNLEVSIKNRKVDFLERRMNEFYGPFLAKLNDLRTELFNEVQDTNKLNEMKRDAQYFLWQREYMISTETERKVSKWLVDFIIADVDRDRESFRELRISEKEVRTIVKNEMDQIAKNIREFY